MDVSVNMRRKFQQSMPIDIEVPQILFIARVLDIPVTGTHSANCAEDADPTAQFLERQLTRPLFFNDRCRAWFSCSTFKVVDVTVLQFISTRLGRPRDLAATSSRSSRRQSEVPQFQSSTILRAGFGRILPHFSDSVHLDVESWFSGR